MEAAPWSERTWTAAYSVLFHSPGNESRVFVKLRILNFLILIFLFLLQLAEIMVSSFTGEK